MSDYGKLVEELRETATFTKLNDLLSKREQKLENLAFDAAAAIEELLPKRGEIVRCRECRWGHLCVMGQHLGLDGFCSKGEREVQE